MNKKKTLYALVLIMALTNAGCGSKEAINKAVEIVTTTSDEDLEKMASSYEEYTEIATTMVETTTEMGTVKETEQTSEIYTISNIEETQTEAETIQPFNQVVTDIINENKNNFNDYYKEDYELFKTKGKGLFIKLIDFLFYNSQINGVTFQQLTTEEKLKLYSELVKLDSAIMTIEPNYKETLGEKYNTIKDFSKEKIDTVKSKISERIGQEEYESIQNKINEKKDYGESIYTEKKDKVKKYAAEKYQNFKNNNQE